jgi:FAD/FMN-containing dehydrogenase
MKKGTIKMNQKIDEALGTLVSVVTPDHAEWEERRARWNHFSNDTETRIIAVPKSIDDVVKIMNWIRENGQTDIGVRAGGHGFFSTAAVVIDMRDAFSYCSVDQETGIATVGMGQTLKAVDEATHPWHIPMGVVSHTGTGLLLTGGVGYLSKAHGASSDNILEVTLVTSDGTVHVCSPEQESDLFFAVRGAAPNLGVVTEIKAQAYQHPDALCTLRAWQLTEENMQRLFDWADQSEVLENPNITPYIALIPSPDLQAHLVALHLVYVGPTEEDERVSALIAQLDGTGEIVLLSTSRVSWEVPQTIFDDSFPSQYWYAGQTYYPGDSSIPADSLNDSREAYSSLSLGPIIPMAVYEQRGTKSARYHQFASDHCAQPRFNQRWECYIFSGCAKKGDSEDARTVGRDLKNAVLKSGEAAAGGRVHLTTDEPSRIEFYYGSNSERIRKVVAKYDPHRIFASCNGMSF